jgi:hypothetical protein
MEALAIDLSSPITKYSRKNQVSGRPRTIFRNRVFSHLFACNEIFSKKPGFWPPTNHDKINIGVIDNSPQWKKPAPKPICN